MRWVLYAAGAVAALLVVAVIVLLLLGGARGESRLQATIEIARPAPVVFEWITVPSRVQSWVGWLVEIRRLTDGKLRVGSRELWVMEDRNNQSQRMEIQSEVVTLEEGRVLTTRVRSVGGFEGTVTYLLEPMGPDRTLLQYVGRYRFDDWLARLMEPLISRAAQQKLEEDLARLKQMAEAS